MQVRKDESLYISDAISKLNSQIKNPSEVLAQLLLAYIKKNSAYTQQGQFSGFHPESENVQQAKQWLGILLPQKYPHFLKLFHKFKKQDVFQHRGDGDPIIYFIGHLNSYWKNKKIHASLKTILSSFFSIYEFYRQNLNAEIESQLTIQDYFDVFVTNYIEKILLNMDDFNEKCRMASINALSQLSTWIIKPKQEAIVKSLMDYLNQNENKHFISMPFYKILLHAIIQLQACFSPENSNKAIKVILLDIHHENEEIVLAACDAIVKLKDWLTDKIWNDELTLLLNQLKIDNVWKAQNKAVLICGKLIPVMPSDKQKEIIFVLIDLLKKNSHPKIIANVLIVLSAASDILSAEHDNLIKKIIHESVSKLELHDLTMTFCKAIKLLQKMDIPVTTNVLFQSSSDMKMEEEAKLAVINAISHFYFTQPLEWFKEWEEKLLSISKDRNQSLQLRIACMNVLILFCKKTNNIECIIPIINDLSMAAEIRILAIQAVCYEQQKTADELIDVKVMIKKLSENNDLMKINAYKILTALAPILTESDRQKIIEQLLQKFNEENAPEV